MISYELLQILFVVLVVLPIWNVELIAPKPVRGYPPVGDLTLGAALKRERLAKGWTQEETGKYLELVPANYMRFERNIHVPDIYKRKRIIQFIGYNYWDDDTYDLSNRLLLFRIENSLNPIDCGKLIGISRNSIKRVELKIKVSQKTLIKIASFLENE